MPIVLALAAALAYGLSDFVGGVASKRTSAWAVAFGASVVGAAAVGVVALVRGGDPVAADYGWALVAGLGNGIGTAYLYRGLGTGRMGVVSPVSGVGAAVVPVVVALITGERPSALVWAGIVAAGPAIWLVSRDPTGPGLTDLDASTARTDLVNGSLAGLGFGSLFAALGQIPEEAGLAPLALNQVIAAVVIAVVAVLAKQPWVPRDRYATAGIACGLLGATATVAFLLATQGGFLTVTSVLASLYPGFTVLLAAVLLREPIHRSQGVGMFLCGTAVVLVAVG